MNRTHPNNTSLTHRELRIALRALSLLWTLILTAWTSGLLLQASIKGAELC